MIRILLVVALVSVAVIARADPRTGTPPEILLGNRLFDETRFAQFFHARAGEDVNAPLVAGDPVMDTTVIPGAALPGPFRGQAMNCRACHLDVEHQETPGGGNRNYADFARRSPVPDRSEDDETVTVRNSQHLMNASLARPTPVLLHFDGEFTTLEGLVRGTLTGRNFGWLPEERPIAVAHIARVIREDDGRGALAARFGNAPYAGQIRGTDPVFPTNLPVPTTMARDVFRLTDEQVLDVVATFIAAYLRSLEASRDADGLFDGSPYDRFLAKNGLPRAPAQGESPRRYGRRLARLVRSLRTPLWVDESDGAFRLHDQPFRFGPEELQGLRIFLAEPQRGRDAVAGVGNCVACHPPPAFTDFALHNTGVTQVEYDSLHGAGAFAALRVPDLQTRNADPGAWLPPSGRVPRATGRFRAVPSAARPGFTDLGAWNVLFNPDIGEPAQQKALVRLVCTAMGRRPCSRARSSRSRLLEGAVALFKTPGLRDLGHSGPYLHTGALDTLEDVVAFYRRTAALARRGGLRNGARELRGMTIAEADIAPLTAFLRALNEDFQ